MEAVDFIRRYRPDDASRIAFAWNGEHADGFRDENVGFRRAVITCVLATPDAASPELLRELYRAETSFAKEAWGINLWVHTLAELLLKKGGAAVLGDFLRGRVQSMDTYFECSRISIPPQLAQTLAEECQRRLQIVDTVRDESLWSGGAEFFRGLADA